MASDRLRAIWNLQMPEVREYAGLHEFDGQVQDLSPSGVAAMLAPVGLRVAPSPMLHDEAQLSASEAGARAAFALAEIHRWNPLVHLANLDLACYDREYAPAEERAAAKAAHLASWPDAIDGRHRVTRLGSCARRGRSAARDPWPGCDLGGAGVDDEVDEVVVDGVADSATIRRGRSALARLTGHLEDAAATGSPDASLGPEKLALLLGDPER